MKIAVLGNFSVPYTTEHHHMQALTDLGHWVVPIQEGQTTAARLVAHARDSELLVWVHTHGWNTPGGIAPALRELKRHNIPTIAYHLDLWRGLRRERELTDGHPYLTGVQHFFTVDPGMADWLNRNTTVRGHYLPAAVAHRECWAAPAAERDLDVVFVGSHRYHPEWPHRGELLLKLTERYGQRFHVFPGREPQVRGGDLNRLYGRARVVVGDSLCPGFDYPGYWSDRVYETLGRGGFLVHPRVPGMEAQLRDGEHLAYHDYNDFDVLFDRIDHYLDHEEERETIRIAGHAEVHARHTYLQRWQTILDILR